MITLDFLNSLQEEIGTGGIRRKKLQLLQKRHLDIHKNLKKKPKAGFLTLPSEQQRNCATLENKARSIRKSFENVVCIGIGGSALGAAALFKSLIPFYSGKPHLFVIDNPESDYVDHILRHIDIAKTLLVPISKSGNTLESLAIFNVMYDHLKKKLRDKAHKNVLAITEENRGALHTIALKEKFSVFSVPENVGGRFSVFTNVGLLPAAIGGIDIKKLLKGASCTKTKSAFLLAVLQYYFYLNQHKPITVFFPYGKKFEGIADWYIQLLAESIGKNYLIGPTPMKAIGAIDQHAQLQLFMEGPDNKFTLFLENTSEEKLTIPDTFPYEKTTRSIAGHDMHSLLLTERKATAEALAIKHRPNLTITLPSINEENIGELLYLLELQVAYLGELFGINAYDQPGVEPGKILTKRYLTAHVPTKNS